MYTALYRTQRPEVFSEILGQEHIVKILKNQIATGTVSHAYLFCGTRGTGKTTTARILAKAVNCLDTGDDIPCGHCENCMAIKDGTFMDVIEIDAASNNGVDNIRELRESVKYPPAAGRKKVYIIDEVHMLSSGAANALLKTLEEPPENVMFILATTDPQKLPQTILSRCMRLDFKRIPDKILIKHFHEICEERGVIADENALRLIAANADGSVRDGLSILDQCLSAGEKKLNRDLVLDFLGTVSEEFFISLTEKVSLHNVADALLVLDSALQEGKDVKQLMKDWMSHYRNLLISKYIKNPEDMLNMSTDNIEKLREQSNRISLEEINNGIITLSATINDARYSTQPRILLELAIVSIASGFADEDKQSYMPKTKVMPQQSSLKTKDKFSHVNRQSTAQENKQTEKKASKKEKTEGATDVHNAKYSEEEYDLDDVWSSVFEMGEDIKGSFNILRTSTSLAGINDHEFKIIVQSEFTKHYVEENRENICKFMEQIVGRKLKLVCKLEGQPEDEYSKEKETMEAAKEVKDFLGITPRIE